MKVIQINVKNVIYVILFTLLTTINHSHTTFNDSLQDYVVSTNSTPVFGSRRDDNLLNLCEPGSFCSDLSAECMSCKFNYTCIYGSMYKANCTVKSQVNCVGNKNFERSYVCRYCYQTEHWEHSCNQMNECNSRASPQTYYKTNCTINNNVLCLGKRKFLKKLRCNWTIGYKWSTALLLSIIAGGFGTDRFYLGHWQEGIGKLFCFGGLGVWTLIDVILISVRYIGPADGSLYV